MNTQKSRRPEPYVWVSWITKLLAGESSCLWSAWFRAHFQTAKAQNGLDLGTWQIDHSAMLRKVAAEHEAEGLEVFTEVQNAFNLKGRIGTLAGKPDVVAVNGKVGLITDTKTGTPKASDRVQVLTYMWALPKTNPAFADVKFDGRVVYKTGYVLIPAEEAGEVFIRQVCDLMRVICGDAEPHKAPSFKECKFCPIGPEDCVDRVQGELSHHGETDEF
jgi:hypothetical protein